MSTCPHCGYENVATGTCPLCGTAADAGSQPTPVQAATVQTGPLPEWEDPSHAFPRNLYDTWRRSMFEPTSFFRAVPYDQPATRPVLYYLIVSVMAALFVLWWNAIFATVQVGFMGEFMEGLQLAGAGGSMVANALFNFFAAPFAAVFALVVWTLILHVLVLILAKERRGVGATVRVLSYAAGPVVLWIVPFLGNFMGFVWGLVLTVIGIREAHRTSTGAAVAIVLVPLMLFSVLFFVLILLLVAALGSFGP